LTGKKRREENESKSKKEENDGTRMENKADFCVLPPSCKRRKTSSMASSESGLNPLSDATNRRTMTTTTDDEGSDASEINWNGKRPLRSEEELEEEEEDSDDLGVTAFADPGPSGDVAAVVMAPPSSDASPALRLRACNARYNNTNSRKMWKEDVVPDAALDKFVTLSDEIIVQGRNSPNSSKVLSNGSRYVSKSCV
jgi:hypothetical protein